MKKEGKIQWRKRRNDELKEGRMDRKRQNEKLMDGKYEGRKPTWNKTEKDGTAKGKKAERRMERRK